MGRGGGSRAKGLPITSEAALNRLIDANPGSPLALAIVDIDANLVDLNFDNGLYTVNKAAVAAAARQFVAENRDISYSKKYLISLAQEDALQSQGFILNEAQAIKYYNDTYKYRAQAILATANAGGVKLTEAQRTRLGTATRGGFINSQFTTASSERGSLANASLGTRRGGGGVMTDAARREMRRNFLEITGRLR